MRDDDSLVKCGIYEHKVGPINATVDFRFSVLGREEFLRVLIFSSLVVSIFDRQGNGSISVRDLTKSMTNLTNRFSEEQILKIVQGVQTTKNGVITYEIFVELLKTTRCVISN